MRKLILGSLVAVLLTGCAGASNVSQSSTLAGEWICHTIPTKDKQTYDRVDHFVLKSDGAGMLRGISSIELDKESTLRYLIKGKVKWQSQTNVLSFDFINRAMVPAHSKNVAKAIKQNKALQKQEKEQLDAFYSKSADHVDMPIELKQDGNELLLGKDYATCRRVTEHDKDIQLLNKYFSAKR
jgi:raw score 9.21